MFDATQRRAWNSMCKLHLAFQQFDAMITSAVCFAAGSRKIYTNDLREFNVHGRKMFRGVVGPSADID